MLLASLVKRVKSLFKRGKLTDDPALSTELRDAVANQTAADAAELAGRLTAKEITLKQFQAELYLMTRNATISQYALGKGGMAALTPEDIKTLGQLIGTQADYLRDFVGEIGEGKLTPEQIANRAAMYPESAIEAHSRGVAAQRGVDLPEHPPAHPGCRCVWTFGTDTASWQTAEDERVCPVCSGLASQYSAFAIGVAA